MMAMAIKHTIGTEDGKQVEVSLTPIKAIRRFCLECMCWGVAEVSRCTAPLCPLFPFRMGDTHADLTPEDRKRKSERMSGLLKERGGKLRSSTNLARGSTIST
jgi:hypothetical protein